MDLRRLGLFLAVVDHGGFTAAARAIHVAQPAVSLAVRELEDEVGTTLLVRSRHGTTLTAAGEALVGPARQAQRDLDAALAAVAAVTGLVAGRLDIASLPTLAADPLAGLVGRFRAAHPGVSVRLVAASEPPEVVDAVRSGAAELGVSDGAAPTGGLIARPMADQELVAVLPASAAVSARALTIDRLAGLPLVLTEPGSSLRTNVEQAFAERGVTPVVAVESAQRDAMIPLVLAGAGAAVLPASLAAEAASAGAVVRPLRPPLRRQVALLHRPGALSPAAARFLEVGRVRQVAGASEPAKSAKASSTDASWA